MSDHLDPLYNLSSEEPRMREPSELQAEYVVDRPARPFSDEATKALYFRYHSQRSKARRAALRFPWLTFDEFLQDIHLRTRGNFHPQTHRLKFGKPVNGGYLKDRLTVEVSGGQPRRQFSVDTRLPAGLLEQRSEYMELLSDVQKLDSLCEKAARIVTALDSEGPVDLNQLITWGTDQV